MVEHSPKIVESDPSLLPGVYVKTSKGRKRDFNCPWQEKKNHRKYV